MSLPNVVMAHRLREAVVQFPVGSLFDSSAEKGPFSFALGAGKVIRCWDLTVARFVGRVTLRARVALCVRLSLCVCVCAFVRLRVKFILRCHLPAVLCDRECVFLCAGRGGMEGEDRGGAEVVDRSVGR